MAIEHRVVETNGIRLHCAVGGSGPLVIFLHGFPEFWYSWRHQLAALEPHFQVVAPDLRGYNESDKPAGVQAYDLPVLVDDVAGLIAAFGAREAVIVGHDWGGGIAWQFAMDRPQLTRKLVVMNCPHLAIFGEAFRSNLKQLFKSWYMFFFQLPVAPEISLGLAHAWPIANNMRSNAVQKDAITDEYIEKLRDACMRPGVLHSAVNYYRAAFRNDRFSGRLPPPVRRFLYGDRDFPAVPASLHEWPTISSPTMLIWGEQDFALEKSLTYGMDPLFTAPPRIEYVPDSGHWVPQEKAQRVNELLLDFLGDVSNASVKSFPMPDAPPDGPPA
jgi:pimeloyl-ACP methyl ester carboxylesterase